MDPYRRDRSSEPPLEARPYRAYAPPPPAAQSPAPAPRAAPNHEVAIVIVIAGVLATILAAFAGSPGLAFLVGLLTILGGAGYLAYGHWRDTQAIRLYKSRLMAKANADAVTDREAQETRRAVAQINYEYEALHYKPLELILEAQKTYARVLEAANRKAELDPSFRAVLDGYTEMLGEMDQAFLPFVDGRGHTLSEQQQQERLYIILAHLQQLAFGVLRHRTGTRLHDDKDRGNKP